METGAWRQLCDLHSEMTSANHVNVTSVAVALCRSLRHVTYPTRDTLMQHSSPVRFTIKIHNLISLVTM